ncbi:MAG: gluconate 2-dehydrogenase subunit 3 family protein [Actinomycetota bacterium]|nr:gluconate 2-dehydrogenase subunit 3 family protein [Actinomycetota bacterium]
MREARFPTLDEFFQRLKARDVEPDLREELARRLKREEGSVRRVGNEATVVAVAQRLIPGGVPAKALAVFLDEVFDKQLGRADDKEGLMPRAELIPAGFGLLDQEAQKRHGKRFPELSGQEQDKLLAEAERGNLQGPERFESSTWFKRMRGFLLLGYGSDPRGMVQMGFPGPSYKPGHIWLDRQEVKARVERKPGYLKL